MIKYFILLYVLSTVTSFSTRKVRLNNPLIKNNYVTNSFMSNNDYLRKDSSKDNFYKIIKQTFDDFLRCSRNYIHNLKSSFSFEDLLTEIKYRWEIIINNMRQGESGKREEKLSISLIILSIFVFFGMPSLVNVSIQLCSVICVALGLFLFIDGWWSLKNNVSLYVIPVEGNSLITYNSYNIVKHPIYGGLLLLCLGYSIILNSVDKMFITFIITQLLNKMASEEERLLRLAHPQDYDAYAAGKKSFIPLLM